MLVQALPVDRACALLCMPCQFDCLGLVLPRMVHMIVVVLCVADTRVHACCIQRLAGLGSLPAESQPACSGQTFALPE